MNFYHTTPVQVRFNDVDLAGHVNNSVYQEFFDLGRLEYFRQVMNEGLRFDGLGMVIASIRIDFFQPVFLFDPVSVQTKIVSLGNKSLEMKQQVLRAGSSEPLSEATTVMVCFDHTSKVSAELPESWKEKVRLFEKGEVEG
ncbi:MAG TPA: thioesterase family protein [Prolixibacteraceae bacterium]|nr:thioesterase family protein [Prolixibacteraceae bacterium]